MSYLRNLLYMCIFSWLMLTLFSGCVSTEKSAQPQILFPESKLDVFEISPSLKENTPVKVAILPFENLTDEGEAFEIVRRSFYNHFASKKYQDVELFQVDHLLEKNGLYANQAYLDVSADALGNTLSADGLIYGRITGFDRVFLGAYSQVAVELEARMVRASDGETLWRVKHRTAHHEGGISIDPISMIPTIIRAALNVRDIELLRTAEDLSRILMAHLPEPAIGKVIRAPMIKVFAHDSQEKWKKAGETIRVAMVGDPGLLATFDVADLKKEIPMHEEKEGVYSGYYKVLSGDAMAAGMVVGHLKDEKGNQTDWVDPLNVINIDTKAPEAPFNLSAKAWDRSVNLNWAHKQDKDVQAYKVYRSQSPKTGYNEVGTPELRSYRDTGLINGKMYYYKVAALDLAQNESDSTAFVHSMPLKPGPTKVSGNIGMDTVWHAGSSPYIIIKNVVIMNGTTLTIGPGSVVRSGGPGIIVRGRLIAVGDIDNKIQFAGLEKEQGHTIWDGIRFDNTHDADSKLIHCKIKHARAAVTTISSSPTISNNTITQNETGIVIREFAKPIVRQNTIVDNHKVGILCERSDPQILENFISDNNGGGIVCRNAKPIIKNNSIANNGTSDLSAEDKSAYQLVALDNWWGSTDYAAIKARIKGNINYAKILDAPYPDGKSTALAPPLSEAELKQLMQRAWSDFTEGKDKEAAETLKKITAAQPKNHRAWYMFGAIYYRSDNATKAIKYLERAVGLDPANVTYHLNLGLAYQEIDLPKAIQEWRKVLELDQGNENAKTFLKVYDQKTD